MAAHRPGRSATLDRNLDLGRVYLGTHAVARISSFYGITIWMYYDESHHLGRPHFHARYGEWEGSIDIESLAIVAGELPPRAQRLVLEWAMAHRDELRDNWHRARDHQQLKPIEPLS